MALWRKRDATAEAGNVAKHKCGGAAPHVGQAEPVTLTLTGTINPWPQPLTLIIAGRW
jgi:hypothetical protein